MRILVVDDEPLIAQGLAEALSVAGFVPEIVSDGEEAWFRAATESYSAIILDLGLPKLDGISVMKRLRTEGIQTPILVL